MRSAVAALFCGVHFHGFEKTMESKEQRNLDIQDLSDAISNISIASEQVIPATSIHSLLLQHETCESWANLLPVSENEVDTVLQTISSEFEDFTHRTDENETDLRYSAVEMVTRRCIQAYINLKKKLFDEAESILTEAYQLIQYCLSQKYFSVEYEEGLRYVVRTLELCLAAETKKDREQEMMLELKMHLESFDKLSLKNQVGVLAMKQYFLGNLYHGAYNEQIEVAKKVYNHLLIACSSRLFSMSLHSRWFPWILIAQNGTIAYILSKDTNGKLRTSMDL